MEIEPRQRNAIVSLVVRCIILAAMTGVLGTLLAVMLNAAAATQPGPTRSGLVRLAIICLAALAVTIVLLVWAVIRFFTVRAQDAPLPRTKTEHIDAWELAGKRFRLSDEDKEEGEGPEPGLDAQDDGGDLPPQDDGRSK